MGVVIVVCVLVSCVNSEELESTRTHTKHFPHPSPLTQCGGEENTPMDLWMALKSRWQTVGHRVSVKMWGYQEGPARTRLEAGGGGETGLERGRLGVSRGPCQEDPPDDAASPTGPRSGKSGNRFFASSTPKLPPAIRIAGYLRQETAAARRRGGQSQLASQEGDRCFQFAKSAHHLLWVWVWRVDE